ncbi:hypothetical protein Y1Q_0008023 [Alligator mississippiensis]|uniref:Uncharacterized protein n=1 Tax=Alligator mississippiensis TaxID=8496 RepID=A0A151NF64_ALLMI|nr:hypothetical protein Y1Q_0008023 [Alligator mississippiensis]
MCENKNSPVQLPFPVLELESYGEGRYLPLYAPQTGDLMVQGIHCSTQDYLASLLNFLSLSGNLLFNILDGSA